MELVESGMMLGDKKVAGPKFFGRMKKKTFNKPIEDKRKIHVTVFFASGAGVTFSKKPVFRYGLIPIIVFNQVENSIIKTRNLRVFPRQPIFDGLTQNHQALQ